MKDLHNAFKIFANMISAGVCISIGAYAYLNYPGSLGALLFSTGLIAVLHYNFIFYTGASHKVKSAFESMCLVFVLILNIIGCWMSSWFVTDPYIISMCQSIVEKRAELGFCEAAAQGIGCGFLITLAIQAWNRNNKFALFICVPTFILAGFTHSITDAFFYCVGWKAISWNAFNAYCGTVIGNFIGSLFHKLGAATVKAEKK